MNREYSPNGHARPPCRRAFAAAWFVLIGLASSVLLGCGYADSGGELDSDRPIARPRSDADLPGNLAPLAGGLYSQSPADRAYAARQIGRLGPDGRSAAALLVDRLSDPSWLVRRQAAEALGLVGDTAAVEPLIEVVSNRNGDWSVRAAAARSLGRLEDPQAVEPLIAVLNDMSAHVRHGAVVALGEIGTPETKEPLAAAAQSDSDAAVRFSAAAALSE